MCISVDEFEYLLDFAMKHVEKSITAILNGEISPKPLKEGNYTSCDYCDYIAICKFGGKNYKEVIDVSNIEDLKNIGVDNGGI